MSVYAKQKKQPQTRPLDGIGRRRAEPGAESQMNPSSTYWHLALGTHSLQQWRADAELPEMNVGQSNQNHPGRQVQLKPSGFFTGQDQASQNAPFRTAFAQRPHRRNRPHTNAPPASAPPAAPTAQAPVAQPTLTVSNNGVYGDGSESHERVGFDVSWPGGGLNPRYYALVNKVKGMGVDGRGHAFQVVLDQLPQPFYFPSWRVDSQDHDPVYASTGTDRWTYTPSGSGFSSSDDPGPARASEPNSLWDLCFRTEVHRLADVPLDYSGPLPTPLDVKYWQYYVRVDQAGRFSHRRLPREPDRCANP